MRLAERTGSSGAAHGKLLGFDGGAGGGEARDGHAERRAGDVVESGVVEEADALGVAAMLTADANVQRGVGRLAPLHRQLDELADAALVERGEAVVLDEAGAVVVGEEGLDVVAGEAKGELGEVVGPEREEVALVLGHLPGLERAAGGLDHGADGDLEPGEVGQDGLDEVALVDVLGLHRGERHHDLGPGVDALGLELLGRGEDGADLSLCDLGVGHPQTAATVAHHGVLLMQPLRDLRQRLLCDAELGANRLATCSGDGDELVEGRVEEADGDAVARHGLDGALEHVLHEGEEVGEGGLALLEGVGHDHAAEVEERLVAALPVEHVLRPQQTDPHSAKVARLLGVGGRVGVGVDLETGVFVAEAEEVGEEVGAHRHGEKRQVPGVHAPLGPVEGDDVALLEHRLPRDKLLLRR
mmetsp:Transcript_30325/g.65592  ORF Transcript_30325/g.65592 Transcript_30325/m.65592 type:complete len:414 (-) Transcript_30325:1552-2793(-)